ncbi:universal stress protein [Labilibaculum sp. K2S]|uniref:universal stress protein n=1 Tax=Labilibaculum sp. K2S TaxID=3056386 RepID=UPI0025A492F4|nr:universal stress protein [Labilibaculum sp. K2S]MDM8161154.1 universal stress protein [Labilibaculum sp. K2S]
MKTLKMKRVMIALDYDPTAQKVAEIGFTLAAAMKAEVILMHVITDIIYYSSVAYSPIMGYTGMMAMNQVKKDSAGSLMNASNHFLDKIKDHLGDKDIKTVVQEGDFAESIINTAKKQNADIIVMGSHSKKWLENILMGSVTEKVLQESIVPLFIVPTKKR